MIAFPAGRPGGRPHFRVFGIPVRVDLSFFLIVPLLGYSGALPARFLLYWVPIVFVSILLHELGHAVVAAALGDKPTVTLFGFGGFTTHGAGHSRAGHIAITLAGPLSALLLLGLPSYLLLNSSWVQPVTRATFDHYVIATYLVWVNVWWSIANLLPILPLDGGQVMSQLFGVVRARQLTVLAGGAAAWWALTHDFFFAGIFAAMFALQSFLALRAGASTAPTAAAPMPVASSLAVDDVSRLERTFIEGPPTDLGPAQVAADNGVVQPLTERLLTRGLRGVAAAHALAEHLRYARRYPEAVAVTERLYVDGRSDLAQAAFAAACANARTGDTERALAWLDRAVDHGFAAAHVLDGEPDLDAVRHMPGWASVRARVA